MPKQKFSTEPIMVGRKTATPGAAWGLRSALVFLLWKPPHYSGGRLFQHGEFILFHYLLFGELHCAVAVNGLHDVEAWFWHVSAEGSTAYGEVFFSHHCIVGVEVLN